MITEFEAKFLSIDVPQLYKKLTALSAHKVFDTTLLCRQTFDFASPRSTKKWVRVRKEGDKTTVILKIVSQATIDGTKELEFAVDNFEKTCEFLTLCGLKPASYQENYRENWRYKDVVLSIDTWPGLQPFLEIEGSNEEAVRSAADQLDLDYTKAYFGTIDKLYEQELGIPAKIFNTIPRITFDNTLMELKQRAKDI
jgi:adenylate cyclase class 2